MNPKEDPKLDPLAVLNTKVGIALLTFALGGGVGTISQRLVDAPTREQYNAIIRGQDDMVRLLQSFDARLNLIEQERRDERLKQDILEKQRRK